MSDAGVPGAGGAGSERDAECLRGYTKPKRRESSRAQCAAIKLAIVLGFISWGSPRPRFYLGWRICRWGVVVE